MTTRLALLVRLGFGLLFALQLGGCGGGTMGMPSNADAGQPDMGLLATSMIGNPCTRTDPTCNDGTPSVVQGTCSTGERCIPATCSGQDNGFPAGYCSQKCGTEGGTCPTGSVCVTLPMIGSQRCLKSCSDASQCRMSEGYGCFDPTGAGGPDVCYPVQPTGGTNGGAACVTMPAALDYAGFTSPNLLVPNGASDLFDAEGNVDIDGKGHAAVSFTAIESTRSSGMGVASYTEGSSAFATTPQIFNTTFTSGFTSDPVVAYDRQASPPRLYLIWLDIMGNPGAPSSDKALVAWSDADGAPGSWSTPVVVSPTSDTSGGFLDKPWIVARNGTVVATYDWQDSSGNAHIQVVRSSDGGATWGTPIHADMNMGFRNLATPVLDAAGDLYVVWYDSNFSTSQVIVAEQPAGSATFTTNIAASGSIQPGFDDPSIALTDNASTVWVTFSDNDASTGDDLWATVSHDKGATWSTPVKVNDDPDPKAPMPCATHYHGSVAVDPTGRAQVVWYDNRYLRGNVMWAYSKSDSSFSPNQVVSSEEFDFTTDRSSEKWLGDYLGVATDGAKIYTAWTDPRGSASREYYAERSLP